MTTSSNHVRTQEPILALARDIRRGIRERIGALRAALDTYDIDVGTERQQDFQHHGELGDAETAEDLRELVDQEQRESEGHQFVAAAFLRVVEREDARYEFALRKALEDFIDAVERKV